MYSGIRSQAASVARWLVAGLVALLVGGSLVNAQGSSARTPRYIDGVVLVGYKPGTSEAARAAIRQSVGATRAVPLSILERNAEKFTLSPGRSVPMAIKALMRNPNVRYAEPDYVLTKAATSNDPYYTGGNLWGMYGDATSPANAFGSQAGEAWAAGYTGSRSVYIGVIDEGIQVTHPDLQANIWVNPYEIPGDGIDNDGNGRIDDIHGWDFFNNNNSVYDAGEDAHGTHVAGTIGGLGGDGVGVVGVNWQVTMISGKFLGANGGATSGAIAAVDYFNDLKTRHGLNIVATSNSWGGGGFSQALLDAINRGGDRGILFIAAAGNSAVNTDGGGYYPQSYQCTTTAAGQPRGWDCVISVASITSTGGLSSFSNYGAVTVDIGAPGSAINSSVPVNSYASYNGTSMATPHVSGAAALCASMRPGITAQEIRTAILSSAAPTASLAGKTVTGGRLDVSAMMAQCLPPAGPVIGAPSGLTATAFSATAIDLTWSDGVSAESYYEIQRGAADCSGLTTVATVGANTTSYRFTGLSTSTGYCFRVRAGNSLPSTSAWSNTATATTLAPPAPYQCSVTAYEWIDSSAGTTVAMGDDTQASVSMPFSWTFYGTPVSSLNVSSNGFIRLDGGTATEYTNSTIPSTSEPNGMVAPFFDDLNFGAGGVLRTLALGTTGSRRFVVSYEGVPHFSVAGSALSFQVVFEEATGAVVMNYADVTAGSASVDRGASATVGIEDPTGVYGTRIGFNSAVLADQTSYRCTTQVSSQVPAAPTGAVALANSATSVTLSWTDNASDETGFVVQRATGTGSFSQVATLGSNFSSYTDTTASGNTTYTYRVAARNAAGDSAWATAAAVTTPSPVPPPVPGGVTATANLSTVTVTWSVGSGTLTGFDIGRQTKNARNGTWSSITVVGSAGASATTFSNSPGSGTFRYSVRAKNGTVLSAWSQPSGEVTTKKR